MDPQVTPKKPSRLKNILIISGIIFSLCIIYFVVAIINGSTPQAKSTSTAIASINQTKAAMPTNKQEPTLVEAAKTSLPSDTPMPTNTPLPTNTPIPTATPLYIKQGATYPPVSNLTLPIRLFFDEIFKMR